VSVGDKSDPHTANNKDRVATCLIRIFLDGSIPKDNNTPRTHKSCYAYGLRNGVLIFLL
jgi:glucose/arabinose dehydrogenase